MLTVIRSFAAVCALFGLMLSNVAAASIAPKPGVGIYVYNADKNPEQTMQRYPVDKQTINAQYYVYLGGVCTLSYSTTGWQVSCPHSVDQLAKTYQGWFGVGHTQVLAGVEFDDTAIKQIATGSAASVQQAAQLLADTINPMTNVRGVNFDVEGHDGSGQYTLLSAAGQRFFDDFSAVLSAEKLLTIYSGNVADDGTHQWSFWPALNREHCQGANCQQGFWVFSEYDEVPFSYAAGAGVTRHLNGSLSSFPGIMKYTANQAHRIASQHAGYYQIALPASGSANNAAAYATFDEDFFSSKLINTDSYWGGDNIWHGATPAVRSQQDSHIFAQSQDGSKSNIDFMQDQYLCVGLSAMNYVYYPKLRDDHPATLCGMQQYSFNDLFDRYTMPNDFVQKDHGRLLGPALYQINQPGFFYQQCASGQSTSGICKAVPLPETMPESGWTMLLNWAQHWYAGTDQYPQLPQA